MGRGPRCVCRAQARPAARGTAASGLYAPAPGKIQAAAGGSVRRGAASQDGNRKNSQTRFARRVLERKTAPGAGLKLDLILGRVDLLAVDAGHLQQVLESLEVAVLLAILNDGLRLLGGEGQPGLDILRRSLVDVDLVGGLAVVLGEVVDDEIELFVLGDCAVLDHHVHQGAPFGLSLPQLDDLVHAMALRAYPAEDFLAGAVR